MEAAERARRAAAEAQAALEKFRQQNNLGEGTPAPGSTEGQGRSDADGDTEVGPCDMHTSCSRKPWMAA